MHGHQQPTSYVQMPKMLSLSCGGVNIELCEQVLMTVTRVQWF